MKKITILIVLALLCLYVGGQEPSSNNFPKTITGQIRNQLGETLAGATVILSNSRKGTLTNARGEFTISIPKDKEALLVSFIGYAPQKIIINNSNHYAITLLPAPDELDKVVVQAYGTTSKRLATGNIGTVTAEEINRRPTMNPIQILQGSVPGLVLTNASGTSSSSAKIEIRGRNTIDPGAIAEPLYIIDGVPMTTLNVSTANRSSAGGSLISQGTTQSGIASAAGTGQSVFLGINPNDIESIEVLKDADATAIYGSRAANGVILITTKKAKAGKTKAELKALTGFSEVTRAYPLLNTREYVAMRKEALANDNLPLNLQTAPDLIVWDTTRYTDWQHYIFGKKGRRHSIQTNITGGDDRTSFRVSTGYDFDKDIITETGGNYRNSFSLQLNHKSLNKRFGFSWKAMYSTSKIDVTNRSASVLLPPNAPSIYNQEGELNYEGWNPLSNLFQFGGLRESYVSKTAFLNSNMVFRYHTETGINFNVSLGYNNSLNKQVKTIPIASQNPLYTRRGTLRNGISQFYNIIVEPHLEYVRFINKGKLSVLTGASYQLNQTDGLQNTGSNYTNDLLLNSINNAPTISVVENYGQYKYAGIFARFTFDWQNRYVINLNARRDGSSKFGAGRQFGNFGSAAAAWILSEEAWMKKIPIVSYAKLRGSFGITGSDNITDYQYLSLWQYGMGGAQGASNTYNGTIPIIPLGFSDSLLQWEVNRKFEMGFSLGLLKNRILVDVSWYRHRCNNQLVSFPTPSMAGFTSVTSNTPANVQNKGWELTLNGKVIDKKNSMLQLKFMIARNRNKLVAYPNFSQSPYKSSYVIGMPLHLQKKLQFNGIDPETGLYTFEDLDHDNNITVNVPGQIPDDRYPLVLAPQFDGGFTTSYTYKNFSLSVSFYYRKQLGINILATSGLAGGMSNQDRRVLQRWQKPGDISSIGKFTTLSSINSSNYYNYSDASITDASFIRLQNLSLSYQLPSKLFKGKNINEFSLFIQGDNLFLFTAYNGIDPEIQALGGMPRPRIITTGLSCNF